MNESRKVADDDMPTEIDFSGAQRGRFYRPDTELRLPIYLDPEVQRYLSDAANAKGVSFEALVNALLKKDIELIEACR